LRKLFLSIGGGKKQKDKERKEMNIIAFSTDE
jgi:hypothetical protein